MVSMECFHVLQVNGITSKDLTTRNIDLSPQTNYSNGQSNVIGYTYTLTYGVNINNATGDFVSGIVDAIVRVGGDAVQLNGIQVCQPLLSELWTKFFSQRNFMSNLGTCMSCPFNSCAVPNAVLDYLKTNLCSLVVCLYAMKAPQGAPQI